MSRILKIALTAFASLFCLLYALQNLANLEAAHGFVVHVIGMQGHEAYPAGIGPAIAAGWMTWLALAIIIALELTAGLLLAWGSWSLWRARKASPDAFNAAKQWALLGLGLGVLLWFGLFSALGGAYFQMWQTQLGNAALEGAFWYSAQLALLWLMLRAEDR